VTGEVTGIATAVPAPFTGSCLHTGSVLGTPVPFPLPSGAFAFVVTGAVTRTNCVAGVLTVGLMTVPPLSVLTPIPHIAFPPPVGLVDNVHVFGPTLDIHHSSHICIGVKL
jgi:hypothetical protein